ncbi:hypothetical protein RLJV_23700 [Pseudomonas aeruginosa]|nr:hypothetical protein RLJV_23700 [Pseudomonas aeruginosa]
MTVSRKVTARAKIQVSMAGIGGGDRHFAEHAHDQHHQGAGDQVGEQGGRAGGGDGMAGADEQAGAAGPPCGRRHGCGRG